MLWVSSGGIFMTNRYQKQATLGILGLFCIASPLFLRLPLEFQSYYAQQQINQTEGRERYRITQRKQTAEKLASAGVLPNGQKLKIRNYFDDPNQDPKPETTGWLEDEIVFVYDSANVCIGRIEKRKWLWKHHYQNVCKNLPRN
jgi:hypothetical protein